MTKGQCAAESPAVWLLLLMAFLSFILNSMWDEPAESGAPGTQAWSQDARNRILRGALPSPPHLVVQHGKLRPRGGWVSPGCAVTRMLGSGHWLEAAWWRFLDAPWWMWGPQWDFLLGGLASSHPSLGPPPGTIFWPSCPVVSGVLTPVSVALVLEEGQTASSSLAFPLGPRFIFGAPLV